MSLQYILDLPLHYSPSCPSSLLRTISTGFIFLFSYMNSKHIHHIHLHSPFPYDLPNPTDTHSWKKPVTSFFKKVYIDSSRGFLLGISDMYISCFNQINSSIPYYFSVTMLPAIQQLTVYCYIIFICRWDISVFFIL
jgi:hypothetical protein